jgi:hypothetical protein
MKRFAASLVMCAIAVMVAAGALVGCANNSSSLNSEQQANRAYMSKVNSIMTQLGEDLDSFVSAVSRGDVVNMRTQADNAYKALDALAAAEAPEALADVKKGYVEGTTKMREALDAYITLYTDIEAGSFNQSTYESRITEIQKKYDEAVEQLRNADAAAAKA